MSFTRLFFVVACAVGLVDGEARATSVLRGSGEDSLVRRHISRAEPEAEEETLDDEDKQQMDPIEVFRSQMCLMRSKLIDHGSCITWMVKKCMTETSGVGTCDALEKYLKSLCEKDGKKQACVYAKDLGVHLKKEKEKKKKAKAKKAPAPAPVVEEEAGKAPAAAPQAAPAGAPSPAAEEKKEEKPKEEEKPEKIEEEKGPSLEMPKDGEDAASKPPAASTGEAGAGTHGFPQPKPGTPSHELDKFEFPMEYDYSKKIRDLPEHGYDEHSERHVQYDGDDHASDWQKEWPRYQGESKVDTMKRICKEHPDNKWCKRYPFPKKKEEKSLWDSIFR